MKKYIVAASLLLLLPALSIAQWQNPLGADGAGSAGGPHRFSMPDVPRSEAPFLKGPMPLSETWDPNIAALGNNPDGMTVTCFAEDSDNLYLGGDFRDFDTVPADFIVHYNRKTGIWNAMDVGLNNAVHCLTFHNGKLYAGGDFNEAGSGRLTVGGIAEWDGSSWHAFDEGMNGTVYSIAFIGDTMYAGGDFTIAGGNPAYGLAYWDGTSWQEAAGGTSSAVKALVVTGDSLFVGGDFEYAGSQSSSGGTTVYGTALLQAGEWTPLGSGYEASALVWFNGKLWAGGSYYALGDNSAIVNQIAVWDGNVWNPVTKDTSIGTNGTGDVQNFLVSGDTLFALGSFSSLAGVEANGIAMLTRGTWSAVGDGLYGYGLAATHFDGKLYVGGRFTKAGSVNAEACATFASGIWSPVGEIRFKYVGWQTDQVLAIAASNNYVFIGGNFTTIAGHSCNHVAAYDKQSQTWRTLGDGVDGDVYSLALQGNNLIVGGSFNHAGTIAARRIAEYAIASGTWSAMGAGAARSVRAIAVDSSGMVYAPIYNFISGSRFYDGIAAWNGTTWVQKGNGLRSGFVYALGWYGNTLYAGGSFIKTEDGTQAPGIAELEDFGWNGLNGGVNGTVYALTTSHNSLFVGGNFTDVDGSAVTALAEWNGSVWSPIGTGFNGQVSTLAPDGNGGIFAGGEFSSVAGVNRGKLAHWNGAEFGTVGNGVDNTVDALAFDGSILYAGGWFERAGASNTTSLHFAALDGAGAGVSPSQQGSSAISIYPDPASATSTVSFDLEKPAVVRVELFNAIGSRVALLADSYHGPGQVTLPLDASKLSSGMYFLRLTTDGLVSSRSFLVTRR